ncbi:HUWE1-associated protein modifying stress responses-like [Uloborus diversus]|uniref:HUWE1-associated protein modifying stress responses-like n=1 Tax=Uloborus diversus TaxID=327109 RepID=UPI0024098874|nr:HUWE1-associated protein modifying stress responses-like [Uloborus diversus]
MNDEQESLEPWISLSSWEQQCINEIEKTPDTEIELQNARDIAVQKLWFLFQNAATCITQLYKDRQTGVSLWVPFQTAASSVTGLYKECIDSHKPIYDLGYQCGLNKRNRDLLSWAKKKKRHIRREELIAYITGRNPPSTRLGCPKPRLVLDGMRNSSHLNAHRLSTPDSASLLAARTDDFDMFREALAFSTNIRQHNSSSPPSLSRVHRVLHCNSTSTSHNELSAFITEEFSRHSRKRSPSTDVIMDSPTHKRSRLV